MIALAVGGLGVPSLNFLHVSQLNQWPPGRHFESVFLLRRVSVSKLPETSSPDRLKRLERVRRQFGVEAGNHV